MTRTNFESYLSSHTNHFMRDSDEWCGKLSEGFFRLGSHTSSLGREIAYLKGDTATAGKLDTIESYFGAGRTAISSFRVIYPLHKLFTGQMFWATQVEEKGKAGQEIQGWQRSGEQYVVRDWMDIAMDILTLVARLIAPIQTLHKLKVIDIGHHAKGLSGASMGLWGGVVALNMARATRDLVKETDVKLVKKRAWDGIQSGVDLIALPFDFGLGASHPALAITGAAINMLSAGTMLAREAFA